MKPSVLFFDDGGVLNDNQVRGKQWQKFIADYFQPRYGGERKNWAEANYYAIRFIIDFLDEIQKSKKEISYKEFKKLEDSLWTEKMFEFMGIKQKPKEQYNNIMEEVNNWIMPQVRSAYPGMIDLIKKISTNNNFICNTASNENSKTLNLYLLGMEINTSFKYLFGHDLVDCMKSTKDYYQKILNYSGTKVEQAIIIDDSPTVLSSAVSLGIQVIQSCLDNQRRE